MNTDTASTPTTNPLNPGFAATIFSIVLIGLKVIGVLSIPWWLALLPVYFWYGLAIVVPLLILGILLAAVPIIGVALLVGPLIERFTGRSSTSSPLNMLEPARHNGYAHVELPEGAEEAGLLSDHEGPVFGYVRVPHGKHWWGPTTWYGSKDKPGQHELSDNTHFAYAPQPITDSSHANDDNQEA